MLNFQIYYKKPFQRTELTRLLGGFNMVISLQSRIAKQHKLGQVDSVRMLFLILIFT